MIYPQEFVTYSLDFVDLYILVTPFRAAFASSVIFALSARGALSIFYNLTD